MPLHLTLETLSLATTCLLCSYCTSLSTTPPNPEPTTLQPNDTWGYFLLRRREVLLLQQIVTASLWLYHTSLILLFPYPPVSSTLLCPYSENLNPALFSWSLSTLTTTAVIIVGALVRLLAYRQLGANFTFALAKPKQLVTGGIYGYVQHPSYTTLFLVGVGNALMLLRTGGVLGCWLAPWVADSEGVNQYGHLVFFAFAIMILALRVVEEEAMLKRTWGKPWEEYHAKTKRFVPWVI